MDVLEVLGYVVLAIGLLLRAYFSLSPSSQLEISSSAPLLPAIPTWLLLSLLGEILLSLGLGS
ncbi:hypothetical protein DKM44_05800 [Deinococcus irradiatisoli]|uniref:Uncharacterized protein n=1 Tax=Deinococcus irradiatisoli TaxID=2202254 RepID=A0A2Z3JIL6_9DEIO|nr:hypothetical protein DKM44_05800 [Deinococcus irradiatisoli]